MSEPMSRRDALIGAVAVGALANTAAGQQKSSGNKPDGNAEKFTINVRLPDGQNISIQGVSAKIVFNGGGVLSVLPSGILPAQEDAPIKARPVHKDAFPTENEGPLDLGPERRTFDDR